MRTKLGNLLTPEMVINAAALIPELYDLAMSLEEQQIDGMDRTKWINAKASELIRKIQGE